MRTTLNLDDELIRRASELTSRTEKSALVQLGLEALIAQESARRLAALGGSDPRGVLGTAPPLSMILVDTSIWIDHLHRRDTALSALLDRAAVCTHPMIIGELALGSLRDRTNVLQLLAGLPSTPEASHAEVLVLVDRHALHGVGLSLVDAHLLAAVRLSPGARLWTRDRRLRVAAETLDVSTDPPA